ncbi:aminodeoxychorismate synthase, subunit I [Paludibacter propionicigenes WB4]|uniref:Aminodeoxychorismate synthase, subunit I n=1 Tax=Paludibacter propionicigenes (strain DSM 17365 / JCM 13257 / WB4) TaxID=694427 RepID=E4T0T7_PALPW|nr:aminodeoxychorismate synthase component I [Paludibacter propionicigenes]ADQ78212.1 aminodeoxychorismate synthase, subunit I [Paludibacter propionicigenes WB4]
MAKHFPYILLNRQRIIEQINQLAVLGIPFLFIVDYKAESGYVIRQDEMDERFIRFQFNSSVQPINQSTNLPLNQLTTEPISWQTKPLSLKDYQPKFDYVVAQIRLGNSFLTNLTQPTEVQTNLTLLDLYELGSAKYKLWLNGMFTVLSPETFVRIHQGVISSFPMKGTIDAAVPNAEELILNDPKERAEHATIVDLIRNDLSLVAEQVEVKRYRYVEKLHTNKADLLQVSSEIAGRLPNGYHRQLGEILFALLPAGSICGAPKQKTLEIIDRAEGYERGFYTGICGWFDGENLDSAVMIRFAEQQDDRFVFKSGGGITSQSELEKEYEELIQKIYVPIR